MEKGKSPCEDSQSRVMNQLLKPTLFFMSVCGLYSPYPVGKKYCRVFLKVYQYFIAFILVGKTVEYVMFPDTHTKDWFRWTLTVSFFVCNSFFAIVFLISCHREKGLPALLRSWNFVSGSDNCPTKTIKRMKMFNFVVLGTACLPILTGVVFTILTANSDNKRLHSLLLTIGSIGFHLAVWSSSTAFVLVISAALWVEFNTFQSDLKKRISANGKFNGDLEKYRLRHQRVCRLVETVDDTFSPLLGFGLLLNTAEILLSFYTIVQNRRGDEDVFTYLGTLGYWLICAFFVVLIFCSSGALVNHKAHAVLSDLHDININENRVNVPELQVFISRLTNESIGLTAMKMFVINKQVILTISGLLVSYYLVLIQFDPTPNFPKDELSNLNQSDNFGDFVRADR